MNTFGKARWAAAAAAALSLVGGPSGAAQAPSVAVRYGDLDLARDDGVQVLYLRLRAAARQVCDGDDTRDLALQAEMRRCYAETLGKAVATLGNERLAALHEARERGSRAGARPIRVSASDPSGRDSASRP